MPKRDWRADPRPGDSWETKDGRVYVVGHRGDNHGRAYISVLTPGIDEHGLEVWLSLDVADLAAYFDKPDFTYRGWGVRPEHQHRVKPK